MKKQTVKGNAIEVRRESGEVVTIQAYTDYVMDDESLDGGSWKQCSTHYRLGSEVILKTGDNTFVVKSTGEVLQAV